MNDGAKKEENKMSKIIHNNLENRIQEFYTEALVVIDKNGHLSYANHTAEKLLGLGQDSLKSMRLTDILHPEDCKNFESILSNTSIANHTSPLSNFRVISTDGSIIFFEGLLTNKLCDPLLKGFVLKMKVLNQASSNNKQSSNGALDTTVENELFTRSVLASLSDAAAVLSLDGTILAVNKAWEESAEQLGSLDLKNVSVESNYLSACKEAIVSGDQDAQKVFNGMSSVFMKKVPSYHQEYSCFTSKEKKWFILNVLPFGEDDTKVIITHQDITAQKVTENTLRIKTEKLNATVTYFSSIIESSLDLICTINDKMEFETVNKASYKILGYYPEELIGTKFIDYVFTGDYERTFEAATKIYEGTPEYLFENYYIHKSGKKIPLMWSINWDDSFQLMYCVAKDMTESKKLQKSIETERDHFYDMFLNAPSAVVMLKGENHIYEMANPLYLDLIGKTAIIGKTVAEVIPEIEDQGFIKILDSVYHTSKSVTGKEVLVKLNRKGTGELHDTYLNFIFQPYRNLSGKIKGIFFFANDVTEQIIARKMMEKSEKFFKGLLESNQDMLATVSPTGKILYTSPSVTKTFGYSTKEIAEMNIFDFIHDDYKQLTLDFMSEVLRKPLIPILCPAVRQRLKDGSIIWIEATLTNFLQTDGINAIVINFRDISERKSSESLLRNTLKELKEEKSRLITAQKLAKIGSWEINTFTGEATYSDENFYIFGADPLTYKPSYESFLQFVHPEDRELANITFLDSFDKKGVKLFEHRIITVDGTTKWVEEKWEINKDSHEDVPIAIGTCQDITERKVAEQKILQSEAKLKVAQHIAQVGSWEVDLKLGEYSWSDEFYSILEIDKNEKPCIELFYNTIYIDDRAEIIKETSLETYKYSKCEISFRFIKKNGEMGYGSSEWKVEYDTNGKAIYIFGILRDLTDNHKAELERQKMITDIIRRNKDLEQFSYIISHNLRSPVANIVGLTDELSNYSHSPEVVTELREAIRTDVKRLEEVIVDLNMIVQTKRDIVERKEEVSLSSLVNSILLSIKFLIENKDIRVISNFEAADTIWTIKSYMQSIFYNIISNSIKYRQSDKELILEIETKIINKKLVITFKDNGVGIDLDRYSAFVFGLYKRFNTGTEGKGLGLYMVKTQVETLGGTVSIKSKVNVGTEFRIEFEHTT